MRVTVREYERVCEVIDRVKLDERNEDTDVYAHSVLVALGLDEPAVSEFTALRPTQS